ncbi:MAG: class I SAM-dependent methyltransferase [Ignavibacteriales bacterium]|nr:class I SAM-dependent methyltransferase [Ignavibacteriales bacterium]
MKDYFSKHYAIVNRIDALDTDAMQHWYKEQAVYYTRELQPYIGEFKESTILEIGCGIGGILYFLKEQGANKLQGIDISAEQIAVANKYVAVNAETCDAFDFLSNTQVKYDIIIMYDLIEHIPKNRILELIEQLFNALKDGGRVITRTPNMASISGLHSRYIDITHETGFTPESIKQAFLQSPFSSITVHNSYLGNKRMFAINCYQYFIKKLYNITLSEIVTPNLICIAKK